MFLCRYHADNGCTCCNRIRIGLMLPSSTQHECAVYDVITANISIRSIVIVTSHTIVLTGKITKICNQIG